MIKLIIEDDFHKNNKPYLKALRHLLNSMPVSKIEVSTSKEQEIIEIEIEE